MGSIITSPRDLPPNMALLPSGREEPLDQFYHEHARDLRPFSDVWLAIATPAFKVPPEVEKAASAVVGAAAGSLIGNLTSNPWVTKWVGQAAGALIADDVASWVAHRIEHGSSVRLVTVRELLAPFDAERNAIEAQRALNRVPHRSAIEPGQPTLAPGRPMTMRR